MTPPWGSLASQTDIVCQATHPPVLTLESLVRDYYTVPVKPYKSDM